MRHLLAATAVTGAPAWLAFTPAVNADPGAGVPPCQPIAAQAAGLIDVRTVVPDAIVDLRYATPNNFVGVALYPPDARCLVLSRWRRGWRSRRRNCEPRV